MGRGAGQPSSSSWAWSSPSAWSPSSLPSSSSLGLRFSHHQNPLIQLLLPCGCARPSLARCARRSKLRALRARGERLARGPIGKRGTVRRGQRAQNRRRQHRRHGAPAFGSSSQSISSSGLFRRTCACALLVGLVAFVPFVARIVAARSAFRDGQILVAWLKVV